MQENHRNPEDDFLAPAPTAGRRLMGLLRRAWPAQQVPAPFRDSDFENMEWGRSAFEPQSRRVE